jgi:hypothetical protein
VTNDESKGSYSHMTKRAADCFLASTLIILILVPVWAADKSKDEETLKNAATVLQTMLGSKNVPADALARANCVIVLPDVKKVGFVIGGSGGRGPMICRQGKNFQRELVNAGHVQHRRSELWPAGRRLVYRLRVAHHISERC